MVMNIIDYLKMYHGQYNLYINMLYMIVRHFKLNKFKYFNIQLKLTFIS